MKKEPFTTSKAECMNVPYWQEKFPNLTVGFSTRKNGFSENQYRSLNLGLHVNDISEKVIENRRKLANSLGFPLQSWICKDQIHQTNIEKVTKENCGAGTTNYDNAIKGTDGFYTKEKDILLVSGYADCVPLYFLSEKEQLIGLAHAGWKGTVQNIAGKMIEVWTEKERANIDEIFVVIGPSIDDCCYIVDDRVKNQVTEVLEEIDFSAVGKEISVGQYRLNLKEVNRLLLMKMGVKEENILVSSYCTCCEEDLFFSYRRDNGKTGRMMSFIGWKEGE